MKKSLCLISLITLLFTSVSFAQQISEEEAREKAKEFFLSKERRTSNGSIRKAMKQRSESQLTLATQDSAYYVFNVGESQGFVIVSGDERTTPVLGYADKGTYSEKSQPEGLRMLMGSYKQQLEALKYVDGLENLPKHSPRTERHAIEPMVETMWAQGEPFNRFTPNNAPTGCVATAMAQIMNYHQWPVEPTKTIPSYEMWDSGWGMTEALAPIAFDWENVHSMKDAGHYEPHWDWQNEVWDWNNLDYYSGEYTDDQANEVAQLMKYCGHSAEMQYTPQSAGTSLYNAQKGFSDYFDYHAEYLFRDNITDDLWDEILYNELAHGRPVLYGGAVNDAGSSDDADAAHAFVCDGYDGDGMYHFNFGWSGAYDGYFTTNIINSYYDKFTPTYGYNIQHSMVLGIRPNGTALDSDDRMEELLAEAGKLDLAEPADLNVANIKFKANNHYESERRWFAGGYTTTAHVITATITNTGSKPFARIVGGDMTFELPGWPPYLYHYYHYVSLQPGESKEYEFHFPALIDVPQAFVLQTALSEAIVEADPVLAWTSPTEGYYIRTGETLPDDVLAFDLRGKDASMFAPNSNTNTIYYLDGNIPESYQGKNVVVNGEAEEIRLTNSISISSPVDFSAKHVILDISLPANTWVPFCSPFAFKAPEGMEVKVYNYNENDTLFFMERDVVPEHSLCLVRSNGQHLQVAMEDVSISTMTTFSRGADYRAKMALAGALINRGYVYDSETNTFQYTENAEVPVWSGYLINQVFDNANPPEGNYDAKDLQVSMDDTDVIDLASIYSVVDIINEVGRTESVVLPRNYEDYNILYYITLQANNSYGLTFNQAVFGIFNGSDLVKEILPLDGIWDYLAGQSWTKYEIRFPDDIPNGEYQVKVGYRYANSKDLCFTYSDLSCLDLTLTDSEAILKKHYSSNPDGISKLIAGFYDHKEAATRESEDDGFVLDMISFTATNPDELNTFEASYSLYQGEDVIEEGSLGLAPFVIPRHGWIPLDAKNVLIGKGLTDGRYTLQLRSRIYNTEDWSLCDMVTEEIGTLYLEVTGNRMIVRNYDHAFNYCTILMEELSNTIDLFDSSNRDSISSMIEFYDNARYTLMEWNDEQVIEITRPVNGIIHAEMNNLYASRFDADETQLLADYPEKEEPIRQFFERQREIYGTWVDVFCPNLYAGFPYHSGKVFDYHEKQELQDLLDKYYESAKQMFMAEDGVMASVLPSTAFQDVAWNASTIIFNSYQTMENWDDPDPMPFVGEPEKDANGNAWYDVNYDESTASNNSVAGEQLLWYPHEFYCTSNEDSYVSNVGTGGIADVYYRRSFSIERPLYGDVYLFCSNANQHELYINGEHVFSYAEPEYIDVLGHPYISSMARGPQHRKLVKLPDSVKEKLKTDGSVNVIAAKLHTTRFGAFVDCGLYLQRGEIGTGDVNEDGVVDIADAVGVVNLIIENKTEHLNRKVADMNGDGEVSVVDATLILDKITSENNYGGRLKKLP